MAWVFWVLAVGAAGVARLVWVDRGRRGIVAVVAFVLAAVMFAGTGVASAAPVRQAEGAACVWGGIGVGLSWVGVGATAATAGAHGGTLTALAGTQAAAATGAWVSSCPRTATSLFGVSAPWRYRRSGCVWVGVSYRGRSWARTPVGWCWQDVPNVGALRRLIGPKVGELAAAVYRHDVGGR